MWSFSRAVSVVALALGLLMFFAANGAPQQAAAASGALLLIIGCYCIARANDEIAREDERRKQNKPPANQ